MRLRLRCIRDPKTRPSNVRAYKGDLLNLERLRVRVTGRGLKTAMWGRAGKSSSYIMFVWKRVGK